MKKLNEDIIRKLIMETLEEVSLGEGRKKKVEEAEIDPAEDAEGMAALQQPTPDNEVNPNPAAPAPGIETMYITDPQVQEILKSYESARTFIEAGLKDKSKMGINQAKQALETVLDLFPKLPKDTKNN